MSEIEDYLANKERIDLKTFIALCILEGANIMVIHNQTFFEIRMNESSLVHIVHQMDLQRFKIELVPTTEIIQNYRDNYFQIYQIDKPLLSISSYKLSELNTFCKKLNINQEPIEPINHELTIKKRTKQNIYDLIVSTLNKN